jgi:hypothetical protein
MENQQQPERKPITLSVQHLEVLENFISEIPTKYGVALLNFLAEVSKDQVELEPAPEKAKNSL